MQTELEGWLSLLVRYPSLYPFRFALAIGLLLGLAGLLFHLLATSGEREEAADWWMKGAPSRRNRGGPAVALFFLGTVFGLLYAQANQPTGLAAQANAHRAKASVWVDPKAQVYYCLGSAGYGRTKAGRYMSLEQAKHEGYQPFGKPCLAEQAVVRRESKR